LILRIIRQSTKTAGAQIAPAVNERDKGINFVNIDQT
jgi:hypothetical protein